MPPSDDIAQSQKCCARLLIEVSVYIVHTEENYVEYLIFIKRCIVLNKFDIFFRTAPLLVHGKQDENWETCDRLLSRKNTKALL